MLVYSFKGQNSITSSTTNNTNLMKLWDTEVSFIVEETKKADDYNPMHFDPIKLIVTVHYNIFNSLTNFNNCLAKDNFKKAETILEEVVNTYEPIVAKSYYIKKMYCSKVLQQLRVWYNTMQHNFDQDSLKWEVVDVMNHWKKEGYVIISNCNLKKDYWTFSKYAEKGE